MKQVKKDYQKAIHHMVPLVIVAAVLLVIGFINDIFIFLTLLPIVWMALSIGFSIRSPLNKDDIKINDTIHFKYCILQILIKTVISLAVFFMVLTFFTSQLQIPGWWKQWHYIWITINYVLIMINVSCRDSSKVKMFSGHDVIMLIFVIYCFYSINTFSYMGDMLWVILGIVQIIFLVDQIKRILS